MATSGSTNFTLNRNEIITEALENLGVLYAGGLPSNEDTTSASRTLNLIIKGLQTDGIRLWSREWVQKTLSASSEVTGTDGNIYTCVLSHTSAADNRPITGANYTTYWLQSGSTGGVWGASTSYSAIGDFTPDSDTLEIEQAFVRRNDIDYPIEIITFSDYLKIDKKSQTGLSQYLSFDYQLSPRVYVWPQPNETTDVIHYLKVRFLEDFDSSVDNADAPIRWLDYLTWELTYRLSHKFGKSSTDRTMYKQEAEQRKVQAKRNDRQLSDAEIIEPYW